MTLLDYGDRMGEEPVYPISQQVQERSFVGAKWGKPVSRGNSIRTFTWSRILTFGSLAERQTRQLQLASTYLSLGQGDLLIEVENGGSTKIKDFCLQSVTPSQRYDKNQFDLLVTFEGIGGEEVTISNGGYGERWLANDFSTWQSSDSTKWDIL